VQDVVHPGAGRIAVVQLADVAFDELEARPLFRRHRFLDLLQVVAMAGGEVVQAHHLLIQLEQGLQQVAADEAGHAGDQPGFRGGGETDEKVGVGGHFKRRGKEGWVRGVSLFE
jgi:hypothetical protein